MDGLDALVRDLVVLTQVETGEIKMHMEIVNLTSITTDIFDQLENKASKRDISLKIKPKNIKGVFVVADSQRIFQVITNFIDNAIKYGKDGGKSPCNF